MRRQRQQQPQQRISMTMWLATSRCSYASVEAKRSEATVPASRAESSRKWSSGHASIRFKCDLVALPTSYNSARKRTPVKYCRRHCPCKIICNVLVRSSAPSPSSARRFSMRCSCCAMRGAKNSSSSSSVAVLSRWTSDCSSCHHLSPVCAFALPLTRDLTF